MSRPTIIRVSLFMATVVAIWGVLSLGVADDTSSLEAGALATMDYVAKRSADVADADAIADAERSARDSVEPVRFISEESQRTVLDGINAVFDDAIASVVAEAPGSEPIEIPEFPASEAGAEPGDSTTTTTASDPVLITGQVFVDFDGDGVFNPAADGPRVDAGIRGVTVEVETANGVVSKQTDAQGMWSVEAPDGVAVVVLDTEDPQIPRGWVHRSGELAQLVVCEDADSCVAESVGFVVNLRPLPEVEAELSSRHLLPGPAVTYLAVTAADDVIRSALGEPLHIPTVRTATLARVSEELLRQIESAQIEAAKNRQRSLPPPVSHVDTGQDDEGSRTAGEVVAAKLLPNYLVDEAETERLRDEAAVLAAANVPDVTIEEGQTIVNERDPLTRFHIAAIEATRGPAGEPGSFGLLAVIAVMVGVIGLYLSRFRTELWSRPRMIALLGIILLLAGASVRATVLLEETTSLYLLPAVAFGLITAVLFDQRIALLMALGVGVLTALGTVDVGMTVYAGLAAMAPIPFVSAISSRGAFRNAVVFSSIAAATIAAATSWFFHVGPNDALLEVLRSAVVWAFATSAVASLVGLAGLQFFESAFDITTTLGLLDLTDRNHEALQLLQEEAFGTFNHSLMVGTLADAAARAIGANPLLARAMAYYHDLGKTENPTHFIENQFGMQNPHDSLDPKESADIIRSHVTDGVALARQFKIPTEVAQGIVSHHGDGVMRYFYEKARAQKGEEVDVDDFRHIGHKPRTEETAILMLADSLEAACRAEFQVAEPTPDAIEKVVSRIIDEKVEDGQLSESPLTLSELTQIRKAFLDSLVGHYHQRIAYPNFPGS